MFFASGGGVNGESLPNAAEYPEAILSNQLGINSGSTLLVLAAITVLWFAVGLRSRIPSSDGLAMFPVLAIGFVAGLLILQAGLAVGSSVIADHSPETAWSFYELSGTLGFESFVATLLGGAAISTVAATGRSSLSRWFWWLTTLFAVLLTVGGLLEGFGVTTAGRFAIFFGIWAFVAGFALQARPPVTSGIDVSPMTA